MAMSDIKQGQLHCHSRGEGLATILSAVRGRQKATWMYNVNGWDGGHTHTPNEILKGTYER
jgi:hypothetical protein